MLTTLTPHFLNSTSVLTVLIVHIDGYNVMALNLLSKISVVVNNLSTTIPNGCQNYFRSPTVSKYVMKEKSRMHEKHRLLVVESP